MTSCAAPNQSARPLDLNAVIRDAIGLIEGRRAQARDAIRSELADDLPQVPADAVMIEQIVVNPGAQRDGLDARHRTAEHDVTVCTAREGRFVTVTVADRGAGILPRPPRGCSNPSSPPSEEGMGMGLNICRSIAELHRGRLAFESRAWRRYHLHPLTSPVDAEIE